MHGVYMRDYPTLGPVFDAEDYMWACSNLYRCSTSMNQFRYLLTKLAGGDGLTLRLRRTPS